MSKMGRTQPCALRWLLGRLTLCIVLPTPWSAPSVVSATAAESSTAIKHTAFTTHHQVTPPLSTTSDTADTTPSLLPQKRSYDYHSNSRLRRRRLSDEIYLRTQEKQKLFAPDASEGYQFGNRVAIDGNSIVIGAEGDDNDAGSLTGSAYVYRTTDGGTTWDFVQKIVAQDAVEFGYFGVSVAIDGNYIVIGAEGDEEAGTSSGSAYIYTTKDDGATWDFAQKIVAPNAEEDEGFGSAVAIDGDYIVVGSEGDDDAGTSSGSAYIYRTTDGGATWDFAQEIVASDADDYDGFGNAVAIDGNYIVVGAFEDHDAGTSSGSAYIYRTTNGGESWVQTLKLVASDGTLGDWFGLSVAIGANVIAVGADSGVYIFFLRDGSWTQTQKIVPPDMSSTYLRVAISGNSMVIGADADDAAATDSGSAYIYSTTNGGETWDLAEKFVASDAAQDDHFGSAVAIDGSSIIVGASLDDDAGSASGSAYTYRLLTCASMIMSDSGGDGWNGASYNLRDALSSDIIQTGTLALGSSGSDEICLMNGCYSIEVGGGDVDEDIAWSFASLSGGAPYGPTLFVAIDGDIFEDSTCDAGSSPRTDQPTRRPTSHPTPPPTPKPIGSDESGSGSGSSASNSTDGLLIGGIVAAIVVVSAAVGCFCWSYIVKKRENTDEAKKDSRITAPEISGRADESHMMRQDEEVGASSTSGKTAASQTSSASPNGNTRRRFTRHGLAAAKKTIHALLAAGSKVPVLGGVCSAAQGILNEVEALQDKADDIVAAGARIISVVEVLRLLAGTTNRLDTNTEERAIIERRMQELKDLLEAFSIGIQKYREQGWLRQKWILLTSGKSIGLTALDAKIVTKLDDLRLAYHIARDHHMDTLLERQTYALEAAMSKEIDRLVAKTGKTAGDVATELAEDEAATKAVAEAAHTDEKELKSELQSLRSDMHRIAAGIDGLKLQYQQRSSREKAKDHKQAILERYEIEVDNMEAAPFARGGMAQVHKASYAGQPVAVKLVLIASLSISERQRLLRELSRELAIMMQLHSPLIVRVFGVVTKNPDYLGLVLEYMAGGSLRDRLDDSEKIITDKYRRSWLADIAKAMRYLYQHDIEHRDLKANNVLLSLDDNCKIADFGLSRSDTLRTHTTQRTAKGVAGTAPFMSPETIMRNIFTEKSDVYSYGVVVFEVLTRDRPWKSLQQPQIIHQVVTERLRPEVPPGSDAPADLLDLMHRAWAHDPDERPTFTAIVRDYFDSDSRASDASMPHKPPLHTTNSTNIDTGSTGSVNATAYSIERSFSSMA